MGIYVDRGNLNIERREVVRNNGSGWKNLSNIWASY